MENAEHPTSLAVWGLGGPVQSGTELPIKVGVKCHSGCSLVGRQYTVMDADGAPVATGSLGADAWRGTSALYWSEVPLPIPLDGGLHRWTVTFDGRDAGSPHEASEFHVSVVAVPVPDHALTVEVVDTTKRKHLAGAHVRAGAYSAVTDTQGRAVMHVPAGEYTVQAWKQKYSTSDQRVSVAGDLTLRFDTEVVPDKDPQYVRDFWA